MTEMYKLALLYRLLYNSNIYVYFPATRIHCPVPPTLAHAHHDVTWLSSRPFAVYTCAPGYEFGPHFTRHTVVCQDDMTWGDLNTNGCYGNIVISLKDGKVAVAPMLDGCCNNVLYDCLSFRIYDINTDFNHIRNNLYQ